MWKPPWWLILQLIRLILINPFPALPPQPPPPIVKPPYYVMGPGPSPTPKPPLVAIYIFMMEAEYAAEKFWEGREQTGGILHAVIAKRSGVLDLWME